MTVFRSALAGCVAVGLAGMMAVSAGPARAAAVTSIQEIDNQSTSPIEVFNLEDQQHFTIPAGGQWTAGHTWVPWAGSDADVWKKNIIIRSAHHYYYVFQDYNDPSDTVKYSQTRRYEDAVALLPDGTGGGDKFLTVNSDETLSMTNSPPPPPRPVPL